MNNQSRHFTLPEKTLGKMKPSESKTVIQDNLDKLSCIKNLTRMNSTENWKHAVLQRLIIVFLGLLTLGVVVQSCSAHHTSCSAYDRVEVKEMK